jgi:methylphosphotriester-DNA--protein-cysteine methyltransferase
VARIGTTEYPVRRVFSSLAGMPLSEYVLRRRMTVAAADVIAGEPRNAYWPWAERLLLGQKTSSRFPD